MFSMFMFHKQLEQRGQLAEANAAEAISSLAAAVRLAVQDNSASYLDPASPNYANPITIKDASEFVPSDYFSGFKVAIRRDGTTLSAVVVSPTTLGRTQLTNLSAARIASMIGPSGGYLPAVADDPTTTASGTMGLWSLDVKAALGDTFADPVRVLVNVPLAPPDTLYEAERSKLLFRYAMPDLGPAANTMMTDLIFNDGTADTIRIGLDGSITNGPFVLNPDGSFGNSGLTVAKDGTLTTGAVSIGPDGSLANGPFVLNPDGGYSNGAVTVGADGSITGPEFAVSPSGHISAVSAQLAGMLSAAGDLKAGGDVEAGGLVHAKLVVAEGDTCQAGQIAADDDGSTMLCVKGKWATGA
jgi:hypothetical protein